MAPLFHTLSSWGFPPGFSGPQKSQGCGGIICENPGQVWKGLGRWQGHSPRWWAELGEPRSSGSRSLLTILGGDPRGRPSLWVWWRHLGQICPCPAQLLAWRVFSILFEGDNWPVAEPGQDHSLSLGPGLLLRPCTTLCSGLGMRTRQTHLVWGHADFWQPIAGDASSYDPVILRLF